MPEASPTPDATPEASPFVPQSLQSGTMADGDPRFIANQTEIMQRKEVLYPLPQSSPEASASPSAETTSSPSPSPTPEIPPGPSPTPLEPGKDASLEGTWSTTDADGEVFNLTLSRNGEAATDWTKGTSGAKGQHGQWQKTGDTLVSVKYEDGTADAVMWLDGKWTLKRHPRAGARFDPLAKPVPMQKVDPAKAKFIGTWKMNKEPDGSYLTITLYADGRAVSTVNGKTVGTWTVKGNAALCAWPDNWFDSIEPKDQGWQRRSWVGAEANGEADSSEAVRVGAAPAP
ncbi:hypothetical protein BH09VER1_BH09VER1_30460 [soil metagenome]